MSSQPNTRRTTAPPPRSGAPEPAAPPARGGLDVSTLVIAAVSSVVAATVVSRLWQAGTVMATAMTPVIVTLIKEALERPAKRVSSIATRSAPGPLARATRSVAEPPPEAYAPPPPLGPDPGLSEMRVYRRERATGRRWKLAIATGLLAFVIGVAVMTLPELVAGRSVVSGTHHTTIFGGRRTAPASKTSTPTDKKTTTDQSTTTTDTQPQDTTTQPDTTTTAPGATAPTTSAPTTPAPAQPAPTQTDPTQTQPPAQTQPPPATP